MIIIFEFYLRFLNYLLFLILIGVVKHSYGVQLLCEYEFQEIWNKAGILYTCTSRNLVNKRNQMKITKAIGEHLTNKNVKDIQQFRILNSEVTYLPEGLEIFTNLIGLCVTQSELKNIRSNDFLGLENLEFIEFKFNKISVIPEDAFKHLHKLRILDLTKNKIKEIVCETFNNNVNLEQVWFPYNKIEFLCPLLFPYSKKLNFVDFSNNNCVNKDYSGTSAIKELKDGIKNCLRPIQSKDKAIVLTKPDQDNEINKLKKKLAENEVEIQNLKIDKENLSDEISKLNKEILNNSNNKEMVTIICDYKTINSVYTCITKDYHFNRLNLKSYHFEGHHIENLKDVNVIELIMENLSMIYLSNDFFESFPNLQIVAFNNLQVRQLTRGDFKGALNVNCLTINYNEITTLEERVFEGAENLETIIIESNLIDNIFANTFEGLTMIMKISLKNNKINNLHTDTFKNLINLKELILSSNQLSFLDGNLFENNKNLETLFFDQNVLREIGDDILSYSKNLTFVNFKENFCIKESTKNYQVSDLAYMILNCCKRPEKRPSIYKCGYEGW